MVYDAVEIKNMVFAIKNCKDVKNLTHFLLTICQQYDLLTFYFTFNEQLTLKAAKFCQIIASELMRQKKFETISFRNCLKIIYDKAYKLFVQK